MYLRLSDEKEETLQSCKTPEELEPRLRTNPTGAAHFIEESQAAGGDQPAGNARLRKRGLKGWTVRVGFQWWTTKAKVWLRFRGHCEKSATKSSRLRMVKRPCNMSRH